MIYFSEMPKVVGEFDADGLHARIDEVLAENPSASSYDVRNHICGDRYALMENVVEIQYGRFFRPRAFDNFTSDGQVNELFPATGGYDTPVDSWHYDTNGNAKFLNQTEILTGASRWPTEFLIGRIGLSASLALSRHGDPNHRWEREAGQRAIETALQIGDAYIHRFNPGEMLQVPKGTLHRRNIPKGENGFRYFIRQFPRSDLFRRGTLAGRIRPR